MEHNRFKFRAWHGGHKKPFIAPVMLYDQKPGDCLTYVNQGQNIISVMEYTGMKDKHGKEIYEYDINQDKGIVLWNESEACFVWEYADIETMPMGEESSWCEVIGNKFEHPELLSNDA